MRNNTSWRRLATVFAGSKPSSVPPIANAHPPGAVACYLAIPRAYQHGLSFHSGLNQRNTSQIPRVPSHSYKTFDSRAKAFQAAFESGSTEQLEAYLANYHKDQQTINAVFYVELIKTCHLSPTLWWHLIDIFKNDLCIDKASFDEIIDDYYNQLEPNKDFSELNEIARNMYKESIESIFNPPSDPSEEEWKEHQREREEKFEEILKETPGAFKGKYIPPHDFSEKLYEQFPHLVFRPKEGPGHGMSP